MPVACRARSAASVARAAIEPMEPRVLLAADLAVELNPNPASPTTTVSGFVRAGNRVYYGADDGVHGSEVWSSDGTAAGTGMVRDVTPGERGSMVLGMVAAGGLDYFIRQADVLPNPFASTLWRTDGTPAGTFPLPSPGSSVSAPVEAMGKAFYAARPAGNVGLYETDGTVAGTRLIHSGASFPVLTGTPIALFYALDGTVYRYDGTTSTALRGGLSGVTSMAAAPGYLLLGGNSLQILDTTTGELGSIPAATNPAFGTTVSGNRVAFTAAGQPWLTDGTVAGTRPIVPAGGGTFSGAGEMVEMDGTIYFIAQPPGDPNLGGDLFKLAPGPAGATVVADNRSGLVGTPRGLTVYHGRLYFSASDPQHTEIWSTDGTTEGTRPELDALPGHGSWGPRFQVLGDRLLFLANALSGYELYQLDPGAGPSGTSDYHVVYNANAQGAGATFATAPFPNAAVSGGKIFFAADDNFTNHGTEPWVTDGTQAGTHRVKDIVPGQQSSNPKLFTSYSGRVYFVADGVGADASNALWVTDGTEAGTVRVGAFNQVSSLTLAGGKLYAGTFDDDGLWVMDAPGAAPREVRSAASGARLTQIRVPVALGDSLYFGAFEAAPPTTSSSEPTARPPERSSSSASPEATGSRTPSPRGVNTSSSARRSSG